MRIHCLENVDKALQFLKEQKVHLENMGSHDIVDGNHRLTLGLVWTIILRFQVPAWCQLACALHTSAASPMVTVHMGGPEPHTLGQGTLIIKQHRGQRGCCQTAMANSLWPGPMLLLLLLLSRFSRVRLCDAIDSSPPGSPVPGILQARTLEWVAIFFSGA